MVRQSTWAVETVRIVTSLVVFVLVSACTQPVGDPGPGGGPGGDPPPVESTVAVGIDFDSATADVVAEEFAATGAAAEPAAGQLDADSWRIVGFSDGEIDFGQETAAGDGARGASDGGVTTGGLYAFEVGTDNTAMGVQPTGTDFAPGEIVLRVSHTLSSLTAIEIGYTLDVLNNEDRSTVWSVALSADLEHWIDVPSLGMTTSETADADPLWTATPLSVVVSEPGALAGGDYLYIRWRAEDGAGSGGRDESALDDISVEIRGY